MKDSAKTNRVVVEVGEVDEECYTYMAWNMYVLSLYSYNYGCKFPAWLSWRGGVDKHVLRLMRSLFDGRFRPKAYSMLLLELHSTISLDYRLKHKNKTKDKMDSPLLHAIKTDCHLGDFGDKKKYNDQVPTSRYLPSVYSTFHDTIRPHLYAEVKKRDANWLMWDVSYKEAKYLCRYRGRPIFNGYGTAFNALGEVCIQCHVFSDSHEQMVSALTVLKRANANLGMAGI